MRTNKNINGKSAGDKGPADSRRAPRFKDLAKHLEIYELVFDSIHNGVVVVDPEGYILYFNTPYGQFIDMGPGHRSEK